MKKLLLTALLIYPALGFAGGGDNIYDINQPYYPYSNVRCIIVSAYMNPGTDASQTLICRRSIIPGILYRDYEVVIPDVNDLTEPHYIKNQWTTISNQAKYAAIGAALSGLAYYGASTYFPEQFATFTKFLSTQKDNFLEAISPVTKPVSDTVSPAINKVTETVSPVFKQIGDVVSSGANKVATTVSSVFETKKN